MHRFEVEMKNYRNVVRGLALAGIVALAGVSAVQAAPALSLSAGSNAACGLCASAVVR
jgi:hypothetical protein